MPKKWKDWLNQPVSWKGVVAIVAAIILLWFIQAIISTSGTRHRAAFSPQ